MQMTISITRSRYTSTGNECVYSSLWCLVGARYYDPQLGQWISHDVAGQFISPYSYAGTSRADVTNPIKFVDYDGKWGPLTHMQVSGFDEAWVDYAGHSAQIPWIVAAYLGNPSAQEVTWAGLAHVYNPDKNGQYFGVHGEPLNSFTEYLRNLHDNHVPDEYIRHLISDYYNEGAGRRDMPLTSTQKWVKSHENIITLAEYQDYDIDVFVNPAGHMGQVKFLQKEQARYLKEAGIIDEQEYEREVDKSMAQYASNMMLFAMSPTSYANNAVEAVGAGMVIQMFKTDPQKGMEFVTNPTGSVVGTYLETGTVSQQFNKVRKILKWFGW